MTFNRRRRTLTKMFTTATLLLMTVGVIPTASGAQTKRSSRATFSYTCCRASLTGAVFHPGQMIKVEWTPVSNAPTKEPVETITLKADVTGPYRSIASLKSSIARSKPVLGVVNVSATPVTLSNLKSANPRSPITLPSNAGSGYYEVTLTIADGSVTSNSGIIVRVTR